MSKEFMTPDEMLRIRRGLGLTQRAVAIELGVKQERYRSWEAGDTRIPTDLGPMMYALINATPPQPSMSVDEIIALRYDLGLTAKNFAALLGTDFATYQDWINGRSTPPPFFLKKMHELRAGIGTEDSVPVLGADEIKALRAASGLNIYKFAAKVDASASEILEGENGARMVRPQTNRKLNAYRDELIRDEKLQPQH